VGGVNAFALRPLPLALSLPGAVLCAAVALFLGGRLERWGEPRQRQSPVEDPPFPSEDPDTAFEVQPGEGPPAGLALHHGHGPAGDCPRDPGDAAAALAQTAAADPSKASIERAVRDLSAYGAFTDFLNRQMEAVTALSESAAGSIMTNLTAVDQRMVALLGFIQQSGAADKFGQVVSEIESQMTGCRSLLDAVSRRQTEDAGQALTQMSQISADTAGILEVIQGVGGIARQTTMLSVNVSIEAARAGEAGKGFSVIAMEIRNLASKAQGLSKDVHARVEALMRAITVDLEERAKERDAVQQGTVAALTQALSALTDNLVTIIRYNREVMQKVECEGQSMAGPIMDIMADVQFQDIIRQQLEQLNRMAIMVDDHLQSLGADLADRQDAFGRETLAEKLESQFDRYVMSSQRQAHLDVRGCAAAPETSSKIELF
jgi:hypothetical protein